MCAPFQPTTSSCKLCEQLHDLDTGVCSHLERLTCESVAHMWAAAQEAAGSGAAGHQCQAAEGTRGGAALEGCSTAGRAGSSGGPEGSTHQPFWHG